MFRHLFINKLRILLRDKALLFWTFAFPFILGTFFYLALGNINKSIELKVIPIAIVNNEYYKEDKILSEVIDSLSKEGEYKLFDTKYTDLEEAKNLLNNSKIDGYILLNENSNPKMVVKGTGINQTIIKSVLDECYQMESVAIKMIDYNPEILYNGILNNLYSNKEYVVDDSREHIDFTVNYFFTLIATTCLYGSLIGLEVIKKSEANLSKEGARMCMSPVHKLKFILSGLLAGYIIQLMAVGALYLYLIFVLKINFGNQVLPMIIISMAGCLAGTSVGTFVGVSNRKSEDFKTGILISVTMACCFLSGMMGMISTKVYFVEKFPLITKINPISMISDGLYSLFAYDNLNVYYSCLISILIFSLVFVALSFIFIRRKKYDSI